MLYILKEISKLECKLASIFIKRNPRMVEGGKFISLQDLVS